MLQSILIGDTVDDIPIIPNMLNMFDPTTLPIAISASFLKAAIIDVISSGKLVPKATIVTPITL